MFIMFWSLSKCGPVNLKRTSMTFKIKLTDNFLPLTTTFNNRSMVVVFGSIGYSEPMQFQLKMTWVILFSSLKHNYTTIQTKSKFSYFCIFYMSLCAHVVICHKLVIKSVSYHRIKKYTPILIQQRILVQCTSNTQYCWKAWHSIEVIIC